MCSSDLVRQGRLFFTAAVEYDPAAVQTHLKAEGMAGHLQALDTALMAVPAFDPASTEAALRSTAEARGIKAGALIHATRVAATGTTVSPGLFEVLALVGRERTHARIAAAIQQALQANA